MESFGQVQIRILNTDGTDFIVHDSEKRAIDSKSFSEFDGF